MHPARRVDRLGGAIGIVPIAEHHRIAPRAELARLAARHDAPGGRIDDLHLKMRLHAPDRRDAQIETVIRRALQADRAGFGHPVGDRHLAHMHVGDHPLHHFDRTGRARHDAGAQRGEVEAREIGMAERRDEHGGDAIERGAAFRLDRFEHRQRIEALARIDHRRAVREAAQIAHHHAEAVIERHRNAELLAGGEADRLADEEAVVEDVVVRKRRALGKAGGAAGELDVDRIVELERVREFGKTRRLGRTAERRDIGEGVAAGRGLRSDEDHRLQMRQPRRREHSRCGGVQLRREFAQHVEIEAGLVRTGEHQRPAADLVERVVEFADPVGRVDVDEDETRLRGGELGEGPLGAVGRPDADAFARPEPERHEARRQRIDARLQLAIGPADVLMADDQRQPLRMGRGRLVEERADGAPDQRRAARPVRIAEFAHAVSLPAVLLRRG